MARYTRHIGTTLLALAFAAGAHASDGGAATDDAAASAAAAGNTAASRAASDNVGASTATAGSAAADSAAASNAAAGRAAPDDAAAGTATAGSPATDSAAAGDAAAGAATPPTYTVDCPAGAAAAEACTVDKNTYFGWRTFAVNCQVCHGGSALGSTFAPNLIERFNTRVDYPRFLHVLANGYTGQVGAMPAWKANPGVMQHVDDLYRYLRARADAKLPPGRPEKAKS